MKRLLLVALVCVLGVSVSGQGVRVRHRILSTQLVHNPPNTPDAPAPADGSTIQTITPTLTCLATGDAQGGALSYTIQFGTNTPPTNIANGSSLGGACSYETPTLTYSTLYYWKITATNTNGSTASAIWSFTTGPDPTPPVDPDPGCTSTTTSPTGHNPLSWTPCRQDTYDHMEADFLAVCPSTAISAGICNTPPLTLGGQIFQHIREVALGYNNHQSCGSSGVCYGDNGQYAAWMYQATGDAAWAARSWTRLDANFVANVDNRPFRAAPYSAWKNTVGNDIREKGVRFLRTSDILYPALTGLQRTRAADANTAFVGGWVHQPGGLISGGSGTADSDQTIGVYFSIVLGYLLYPTHAAAIENYSASGVGGLVPTTTSANFLSGNPAKTQRNGILWYFEKLAAGGEWIESGEYNPHTVALILEGYDAVKTKTGIDYFPEITTWMQDLAAMKLVWAKPTLTDATVQWGDIETPRVMDRYHVAAQLLTLSGLLQGTTPGRKVLQQYIDFVAQYGLAGAYSMNQVPNLGMGYVFFNPYDTPLEWRTSLSHTASGLRLNIRNSHLTDPTASQFIAFYGGPAHLDEVNNVPGEVQHQGTQFGDWELWRNGAWAITHPRDYQGPSVYAGDGDNGPMMHGHSAMKGYNGAFHAINAATYTYVTGTTGGAVHTAGLYQPPSIFTNEWTREMIYVPGTTDTVIIYDRANVKNPFPDRTPSWYKSPLLPRLTRFASIHHKILVQHVNTNPTLVSNAFTWTTAGNEAAKMTVAYPTSFASTTYNVAVDTMPGWAATTTKNIGERKYQIKVYPTDNVLFNTFLTTYQVGTAGTVTATEDAGKAQCAHVTRPTQADVLACFNAEEGTALNATAYHASHPTDLAVVRYRESGFTISWTASAAASTLVFLQDLNPANSWTINVDGGGAVAISGASLTTNKGHYTTTVTGAGAHSIVIVGS